MINKGAHQGPVVALDVHAAGSVVVTGGADNTMRCFDAVSGYCIATQTLADSISAIALHPAFAMAAVAQRTAIKFYDIAW